MHTRLQILLLLKHGSWTIFDELKIHSFFLNLHYNLFRECYSIFQLLSDRAFLRRSGSICTSRRFSL